MVKSFDEEDTQKINFQELILKHLTVISDDIKDIKIDIGNLRSQVNLAGNIAAEARDNADEALKTIRRIDQNLSGIYELAKSGYDIATAIKSVQDKATSSSFPPSEPDSYPDIEFAEFKIVGTGN